MKVRAAWNLPKKDPSTPPASSSASSGSSRALRKAKHGDPTPFDSHRGELSLLGVNIQLDEINVQSLAAHHKTKVHGRLTFIANLPQLNFPAKDVPSLLGLKFVCVKALRKAEANE